MNIPQVAVIIATKNRPDLLKQRALNSVLQQTRSPNILIVVDDSLEPIQQKNRLIVESLPFGGYHIQYLINQRTHGASGAWNTAIDYLSCQHRNGHDSLFLAFLDDDDEWHPNYLENCLVAISSNHCNMVAAGFYRYESIEQMPIECLPPKSLNEDLFLRGNPGIQGSNLFLSLDTMLMAGSFDEHLSSCTDRDLCIRLCELEVLRYHYINELLLNHYADSDRQRLSTPNSLSKRKGLAAFWQKYHGRMSDVQRDAFLDRAQSLFNWKPERVSEITSKPAIQIALTLGIELGGISFCKLNKAIEQIQQVDLQHLSSFNLVLTATPDLDFNDLSVFLEFVRQQGITCYNLCAQQTCIETVTAFVAKENIGHCAWILRSWQPQDQPYDKNGNVILELLTKLGARQLCDDSLNKQFKKQQTELVQKITHCRIDAARTRINKLFCIDTDDLQLLGIGSEAIVMTDGTRVFKCIDYWKTPIPGEQIKFLQQECSQWRDLPGLYALDDVIADGKTLLLTYPYEASIPYQGGHCEQVINLLHSCSRAGIVCNNIHPKNLINTQNEVKLIDYGSDIRPWNELGFEHMAQRAYLTIYHPDHPYLKLLMRKSLNTTNMLEMKGYQEFRQRLIGIDCNLKHAQQVQLPLAPLAERSAPFALTIGIITGDANKLLPLLNSIAELEQCSFLSELNTIVLCNGCSASSLKTVLGNSKRSLGNIQIITEAQQVEDSQSGLFGSDLVSRKRGLVGIAHARSMLQKYVGLKCEANLDSIAWILDDDMRIDARAKQYLPWLPIFKQKGIDVVIGQYEGSSPNPPLNGLRGQLVDLLYNLRWLDTLPSAIQLPDRSDENTILRNKYSDYYYDLSRKHSAHVEVPFWVEPAYQGETVAEARVRLFAYAPLLVTGFPLTRSIIPICPADPLMAMKDTVNRGGNTFVLNPKALTQTPNLILKIDGREARRSDMVWAIINKHCHGLSIKSAPFPVQHIGRVQNEKILNLEKVQDEIMGSALYAGLQDFFLTNEKHNLIFTPAEITNVWKATGVARDIRIARLKHSFYRITGLAQALSKFPELMGLCEYLTRSFNPTMIEKLDVQVKQMNEQHISKFLNQIVPQSTRFANAHQKTVETIE
ncbi:glycosyltransferase family 2 protein [Photobacterium carnosum]|uniref:glycosyltransferase family 2 protein n=1 Tax=Photobacterium carnosum TaxID=2023717 RepID=UPI001E60C98A|nr:glycosyltransferase family A protein [Photobacterium carnosum]MCD9538982.1 glycosyltransferase [Photobacterium carnosum]MCF2163663.1 glycosyltransferase [Photobacterium carnosum]